MAGFMNKLKGLGDEAGKIGEKAQTAVDTFNTTKDSVTKAKEQIDGVMGDAETEVNKAKGTLKENADKLPNSLDQFKSSFPKF